MCFEDLVLFQLFKLDERCIHVEAVFTEISAAWYPEETEFEGSRAAK